MKLVLYPNIQTKIEKFKENFFLMYSNESKKLAIISYEKDNNNTYYYFQKSKIYIEDNIYSATFSNNMDKIYILLLNKRIIEIIDFNLENNSMKISEEIKDKNNNASSPHFQ